MMREKRFLRAVILASAVTVGCGDALSPDSVAGTYQLVRYSGEPVPKSFVVPVECDAVTIRVISGTVILQGGSLALTADGTYLQIEQWAVDADPCSRAYADSTAGTYTLAEPSRIVLYESDATGSRDGRVAGGTVGIGPLVFER